VVVSKRFHVNWENNTLLAVPAVAVGSVAVVAVITSSSYWNQWQQRRVGMLASFRAVSWARAMVLSGLLVQQIAAPSAWAASKHELPAAKPERVGMSTERLAKLTRGMQARVAQGSVAGVVTMVARHGRVVHFEAVGMRDVAANAPMRKDSIFRIYSMSKPVTGVVMRCCSRRASGISILR
jgi:hypothetical protein